MHRPIAYLRSLFNVRPGERRRVAFMALYLLRAVCVYILRPVGRDRHHGGSDGRAREILLAAGRRVRVRTASVKKISDFPVLTGGFRHAFEIKI